MAAVNYDFSIEQGSDYQINFQYNDENGNPVNLTNACAILQMIPNSEVSATTSFSSAMQDSGYTFTTSDKGLITLKLKNNLTRLYNFDSAVYDLDLLQDSQIIRLASGNISIQKRLTPLPPNCQVQNTINENTNQDNTNQTPSIPQTDVQDLCLKTDCIDLDIYSVVYNGSGLNIPDLSSASGFISTSDTRLIENVELIVNNLQHNSPQDLQILLSPPSGNKILLSGNQKIPANSGNFNFMFSNKAPPTAYLHNISNGNLCNIYNKINTIKYSNENLLSSFDHLFGKSVTGVWGLIVKDTDPGVSGLIGGWKLVITYEQT